MKNLLLFIILLVAPGLAGFSAAMAQRTQDVVYLRNESIIRGTVLERDSLTIKIETCCGSVFIFPSSEVLRVEKEDRRQMVRNNYRVKEKGYVNMTTIGSLIGPAENQKAAPFSLLIEHDYRLNRYFMAGVSMGYEVLNESLMPVGTSLHFTLPLGRNLLFTGGSAGYLFSLENPDNDYFTKASGGIYFNPELGILLPFSENAGFVVALGYRYGRLNYTREDWWLGDVERVIYFNRLSLRLGISLY